MIRGLLACSAALCFSGTAVAQTCPAPDSFEPNDDCASATVLGLGLISATVQGDLAPGGPNRDHYAFTVADGEEVTFDVSFTQLAGGTQLTLFESSACTNPPYDAANSTGQLSQTVTVRYQNTTGAPLTVYLRIKSSTWSTCVDYDLTVSTGPIPACHFGQDDLFSPNHSCATVALLTPGTYTDLVVYKNGPNPSAPDVFQVDVPAGHTLHADARFVHDDGVIEAHIYRSTSDKICGVTTEGFDFGIHDLGGLTVSSFNPMTYTRNFALIIFLNHSSSNQNCNVYDLTISIEPPPAPTSLCFGDGSSGPCPCSNESAVGAGEGCESSVGVGAVLSSTGTTSVGVDDLVFVVSQARANQPGMLLQGASTIQLPFKDGILCAGPLSERLEALFSDANGAGSSTSSIVTEGNVSPGQTRIYQHWYRDSSLSPCGTGSNFSSALQVDWV